MHKKKWIIAGDTVECTKFYPRGWGPKPPKREKKKKITREAQKKVNLRKAEETLRAILNENFRGGDYHLVLSYDGDEPTPEEAKRQFNNFMKRLRREYKKAGKEMKYVHATEYMDKRIHHHLVINKIDDDIIEKHWQGTREKPRNGYVKYSKLTPVRNYWKLANYIIKQTAKSFGTDCLTKSRYTPSRNLVNPMKKKSSRAKTVYSRTWRTDPVIPKGYYLDPDSLVNGFDQYTERPYQFYRLIRIT